MKKFKTNAEAVLYADTYKSMVVGDFSCISNTTGKISILKVAAGYHVWRKLLINSGLYDLNYSQLPG